MSKLPTQFDATSVNPTPVFELIPENDYIVAVTDSEMKPTNNKDGEYLNLTLEVLDGPYKGRMIFDRLNLVNKNTKAVEIAQRQLSQICHAVGVLRVNDSAELHNRPMIARVGTEPGGDKPSGGKYADKNKITSYKPLQPGTAAPSAPAAKTAATAAAPSTPAPATASAIPPWGRKAG